MLRFSISTYLLCESTIPQLRDKWFVLGAIGVKFYHLSCFSLDKTILELKECYK